MKLLLDESVTRYLKADFIGHEVKTVREAGFTGLKNVPRALGALKSLQPGAFVLVEATV